MPVPDTYPNLPTREDRRWAWIVIDNPIGVAADCGSAACRETALEDAARAAAEYLEDRAPSLN